MTELHNDKPTLGVGEVLRMAVPAAAGMISATIMQFIDGVMVSKMVGPQALGAQFTSGILSFVPATLVMGICTVINTFVSQNLGAGRLRRCGQYAWHGLYLAAIFGTLLTPLAMAGPWLFDQIARLIVYLGGKAPSAEVIQMQVTYFRVLVLGMPLMLMCRALGQFYFGIHRPGIVVVVSLCAVVVNVTANYALIGGLWFIPAMGLKGAAIGTVIGWGFAFVLLFAVFLAPRHERYKTRSTWRVRLRLWRDILRVGWPAGMQFFIDILAWSVFNSVLVARFGEAHKAASAAAIRYMHLSFMPAIGIGIACTAVVGRHIGEGRRDIARRRAHAAALIAVVYMGACGLAFWVFRYPMVSLFAKVPDAAGMSTDEAAIMHEAIINIGAKVLICAAIFQAFDGIAVVFIGALRGAGDTFWPMLISFVLSWSVIVGGGYAAMRWLPQLESIGPWIAASVYIILLGLVMAWRFETGAWRKIDLLGRAQPLAPPAAVLPQPETPAAIAPTPNVETNNERE